MQEFLGLFVVTFIPIFVAIDPLGMVPIYVGLTAGLDPLIRRRVIFEATVTALGVSILFLVAGKIIFTILNITTQDFQVAGGAVLVTLAIIDIVQTGKERRRIHGGVGMGIVPLGMPLIVGPALLTTLLLLTDLHPGAVGRLALAASLVVNVALVVMLFVQADRLTRLLGPGGMTAVSKVFSLLLAGIGVMMVRRGVQGMIAAWGSSVEVLGILI